MSEPFLPYGRQEITEADVAAVAEAVGSDLITQGPRVAEFERAFCRFTGAKHAVAFSSGTGALHAAAAAAGWAPGDEVLVPPITFAASANCALYVGARPRFVDIDRETWNIDIAAASEQAAEENVKGVVAVSFAGLPVDLDALETPDDVIVIEDGCHALGGHRAGRPIGGPGGADMTTFSFHPVKSMTTGEGGMVTTESDALAERLLRFRTHGIPPERDPDNPEGPWHYDMIDLGFNYRITDVQCALGISQLSRLPDWVARRNELAGTYREALGDLPGVELPPERLRARSTAAICFRFASRLGPRCVCMCSHSSATVASVHRSTTSRSTHSLTTATISATRRTPVRRRSASMQAPLACRCSRGWTRLTSNGWSLR